MIHQRMVVLNGETLTIEQLVAVARRGARVQLDAEAATRVQRSRDRLEAMLARQEIVYGVNTGFGGNVKFLIPPNELQDLQSNLMDFLSCGTGPELPVEVIRGAMALRVNALSKGYSAIRPVVLENLVALLNAHVTPVVPRMGSVGASGDLIPSAYVAKALLGRGEVIHAGRRRPAAEALAALGLEPLLLEAKEGLALVNGTTAMTSIAALNVHDAECLAHLSLLTVSLATEVLKANADSLHPVIHAVKNHPGQIEAARLMRGHLENSNMVADLDALRDKVSRERAALTVAEEVEHAIQTPYSLRCAAQGIGPVLEQLAHARATVECEMNSANDNPLIDPESGRVLHTGNFYGGHIARTMDGLKIDMANLANWSHALMAMLMDPRFSNGLPANLSPNPGTHSGFKGMQISHTSLVVACRQLAGASSIHTLPTEQYNQDIVSLGYHAALGAAESVERLGDALAILTLALCQAVNLRGEADDVQLGAGTDRLYAMVRELVPAVGADRSMDVDIRAISQAIRNAPFELLSGREARPALASASAA